MTKRNFCQTFIKSKVMNQYFLKFITIKQVYIHTLKSIYDHFKILWTLWVPLGLIYQSKTIQCESHVRFPIGTESSRSFQNYQNSWILKPYLVVIKEVIEFDTSIFDVQIQLKAFCVCRYVLNLIEYQFCFLTSGM